MAEGRGRAAARTRDVRVCGRGLGGSGRGRGEGGSGGGGVRAVMAGMRMVTVGEDGALGIVLGACRVRSAAAGPTEGAEPTRGVGHGVITTVPSQAVRFCAAVTILTCSSEKQGSRVLEMSVGEKYG